MSSEKQTIYGFDLNIIHDYFLSVGRQGPGNPEITLKALSFVDNLTEVSRIADIGCGTGGQTMVLAQNTTCKITGIDLCQDFITRLNQNAENNKLQDRVKGIVGDMKKLLFQEEELDLIWSEGSIYNIGFEHGLNEWRKFLKKGGYIAITENTWFTEKRPSEIEEFWQKAYPEIDVISNKVAQMQKAGYLPVATFVVPESCWTEYYSVMQGTHDSFLKKHKGNKTAEEFIGYQQYESGLYQKYKAYYGYVFYIGKRIE
ncbi:MAG: class I SAM-dependent methyltransferase [Bacteroidales bacterium]|nr:class I SAM-dependent methyltransferase [Bacteroidales bacterium]